ncbi:unnamed protein product [Meganyctiphanes norvegica]|uniref:Uncharacterized protein n=1 Tax=Meganyctiphanes norvegica TaxID=48144 RepID=A0AAV2QP35_MEGNR
MPRYIGPLSGKGGTADQNKQADPLPSATRGATKIGKKENASWADGRTFSECDRADKAEEEEEEVKKLPPAVHTFTAFSNNPKGKQIVTTDISLYVQRRNLWRSTGTLKEELLTKLKVGEEYDGYIVKTKASDYDYGTKMWAQGRVAPPDPFYPKDGEEYDALVIDRIGNNMLLGVGPHIAFASKEAFRKAGLNTDTLKLPYGCIKVNLHPVCSSTRPKDLLIAAWTADLKPEPAKYSHVLNF